MIVIVTKSIESIQKLVILCLIGQQSVIKTALTSFYVNFENNFACFDKSRLFMYV